MSLFHEISEIVFSSSFVSASHDENGCLVIGNEKGEYWRFNAEVQEEAEYILSIFSIYVR